MGALQELEDLGTDGGRDFLWRMETMGTELGLRGWCDAEAWQGEGENEEAISGWRVGAAGCEHSHRGRREEGMEVSLTAAGNKVDKVKMGQMVEGEAKGCRFLSCKGLRVKEWG